MFLVRVVETKTAGKRQQKVEEDRYDGAAEEKQYEHLAGKGQQASTQGTNKPGQDVIASSVHWELFRCLSPDWILQPPGMAAARQALVRLES
jgi:hypothetical protein